MPGYIGGARSVVSSGAERKQTYTITTTTSTLTGLAYTPTKVHVFHNGIRLVDGTDYTATNGTSITLTNAAQDGDEVVVISNASFSVSDTVSASNGGTFAGNVSMSGNLDVAGTLGVGIDTPDTALHVAGGANPTLQLTAYEGTQNCDVQIMPIRAEFTGSKSVMSLRTHNGTSMAEGLRIDHNGRVTQPKQLHIFGSPNNVAGNGIANAFYTKYPPTGLSFSNSRITIPSNGKYLITFDTIADTGSGRVDTYIRINGNIVGSAMGEGTGFRHRSNTIIVKLYANDYIQFEHQDYYNSGGTSFEEWRTASVTQVG